MRLHLTKPSLTYWSNYVGKTNLFKNRFDLFLYYPKLIHFLNNSLIVKYKILTLHVFNFVIFLCLYLPGFSMYEMFWAKQFLLNVSIMRLLSLDIFFTFNVHNVYYMAFIFLWNVPYDFYCVSWNVNFGFFKKDLQWALISFLTFLNSISDLFVKSILSYGMTSYTFQDFIKEEINQSWKMIPVFYYTTS